MSSQLDQMQHDLIRQASRTDVLASQVQSASAQASTALTRVQAAEAAASDALARVTLLRDASDADQDAHVFHSS